MSVSLRTRTWKSLRLLELGISTSQGGGGGGGGGGGSGEWIGSYKLASPSRALTCI